MSLEKIESRDPALMPRAERQAALTDWAIRCFGADHQASVPQRAVRALEEDVEKFQAAMHRAGHDPTEARAMAHQLVNYIFDRAPGDLAQEIGGTSVTTLLLAQAAGLDADTCEVTEIARVLAKDPAHFAARNAAKNAAGFDVTQKAYQVTPRLGTVYAGAPPALEPEDVDVHTKYVADAR